MLHFLLLMNRHGKVRLSKWFSTHSQKERTEITKEVRAKQLKTLVIGRSSKLCNFLEWRDLIVVYKRYASLYFVASTDKDENELLTLEIAHFYVELLDKYFGNVCELDIIFNFHKAYYMLDEMIIAGHMLESSKKQIQQAISSQDCIMQTEEEANSSRRR